MQHRSDRVKYIVLGCNHGIQRLRPLNCFDDTSDVRQQRSQFRDLLAKIINESKIELIGEERNDSQETIAQELARKSGICCPNIDANLENRKRLGIPCDYLADENGRYKYGDAERAAWLKKREEYMLGRIRQEQGNANSVLVICGFRHMAPLAGLLQQGGPSVCIRDCRNEEWYQPDVFPEDC